MGHQKTIKQKLGAFLTFCYQEQFGQDETKFPNEFKQILTSLNKGHCFGFSLIHGAMDIDKVKSLPWWEFVMKCVEKWDETKASLDKKIAETEFAQQIPASITGEARKKLLDTKLGSLCELAAYFIVYHHVSADMKGSPFLPEVLNQLEILQPENNERGLFWIVDAEGNKLTIKDRQVSFAGRVSSVEEMDALLSTDNQEICLLHNGSHCIRVGRHGDKWFVYNPSHEGKGQGLDDYFYLQYFPKSAAIKKIVAILGEDIAIEKVSVNEAVTPSLNLQTEEKMNEFIKHHLSPKGLILLAKYLPHVFMQLINRMIVQDDSLEVKLLKENFAKAVITKDKKDWTGLHMMVRYSPDALTQLITHMANDHTEEGKAIKKSFAVAFGEKNKSEWSVLHMMVNYSSNVLTQLITYMANDHTEEGKAIKKSFATAFMAKQPNDWNGWPALHMMTSRAPTALKQLIAYIANDHTEEGNIIKKCFAFALTAKDNEGWSGLHMLAHYIPDVLTQLISSVTKDHSEGKHFIRKCFAAALAEKDNEGWNGLQMLAENAPQACTQLMIALAEDYPPTDITKNIYSSFVKALLEKNKAGETAFKLIPMNAYNVRLLVRLAPHAISILRFHLEQDHAQLLDTDCGLQNGLSLREQLAADVFLLIHERIFSPKGGKIILNELNVQLNERTMKKIVSSLNGVIKEEELKTIASLFSSLDEHQKEVNARKENYTKMSGQENFPISPSKKIKISSNPHTTYSNPVKEQAVNIANIKMETLVNKSHL